MAVAMAASLGFNSCNDVLEEQPRGIFEPGYFETEEGVKGGLTGLYQNLRYIYGNMYYHSAQECGTDEYTYAQSDDGNWGSLDLSGKGELNSTSCRADNLWGMAFRNINSANSLIVNGEKAGLDASLLAEARFFRAFYYFKLVQTFGGVPLDLGSGELQPNTSPSRVSVRNTVPEVYKAVFADLEQAVKDLPETPRYAGTVSKNTARLILSKAYLTFAWWLENPKGIDTYPACDRKDLNGKTAANYFQMAYDVANTAIENPGPYALMPTFRDMFLAENDRANTEYLLVADHTESDGFYNGGDLGYAGGNGTENTAIWAFTWNYCNITAHGSDDAVFNPAAREAAQSYGRPWTRTAPTHEGLALFTDRDKDTRFDATFVTAVYGNWQRNGKDYEYVYCDETEKLPIAKDGVVLLFTNEQLGDVAYPESGNGPSNCCAGYKKGTPYWVIEPDHVSRLAYPSLWKYGTYRTDNNGGMGSPNGALTRPFPVMRFAEFYFIAAEAVVKGATGKSASELIKVIRDRAGKSNFDKMANKATALTDNGLETPANIDLNFILDERAREFYGESLRWFDLVRTQTWNERADSYTICEQNDGGAWVKAVKKDRTIQKFHYLRPIPQGQLDAMEMTDAEKKSFQNPGY